MNLEIVLKSFPELKVQQIGVNSRLNYIQSDSRKIQHEDIFILYKEFEDRASLYIQDALQKGAKHFILPDSLKEKISLSNTSLLLHPDPRKIHGKLASFLLGNPSQDLTIFAVTGTNGKTSTTHILYNFLEKLGKPVGIIGTIYAKYKNVVHEIGYTTPDPSLLNSLLFEMKNSGIEYVVMEASSHGLKLNRMEGIELNAGIFTNLTEDHLDFHKNMEDYLLSKFHLFELLQASSKKFKCGIVNLYSEFGIRMKDLIQNLSPNYNVLYYGEKFKGKIKNLSLQKTEFEMSWGDKIYTFETNLLGEFNFENVSLAILLIREFFPNLTPNDIQTIISNLQPIPGRFELIYSPKKDKLAIVDYAHTPDALENILKSVNQISHSKIITIFGCGGDRDKTKRPLMGEIAARLSDFVILTSDNPRTENPETILDEIEKGFPKSFQNYFRIENRKKAIQKGLEILPELGILVIAGKGHENYQIIGKQKFPFSDQEEVKKLWSKEF